MSKKSQQEWILYVQKVRDEYKIKMHEAVDAFQEYADRRKDKGTASAKIKAWNNLAFKMDALKKSINP